MSVIRRLALATAVLATTALVAPAAGAANAGPENTRASTQAAQRPFIEFRSARLQPVPHDPAADGGSSTTGNVGLLRVGDKILVLEFVQDVAANLPHAQHIHGVGLGICPGADRRDENGLIKTPDGLPDYGGIQASLTTTGDASPASALAVDRFPAANQFGFYGYGRVLTIGTDIPEEVGYNLDDFHIVVHGIDINGNGAYDFDAGPSPLDPDLPLEATIPTACGEIR